MVAAIRTWLWVMGVLTAAGLCAAETVRGTIRPDAANVRYAEKRPELTVNDPSSDRLLDVYLPRTEKPKQGYPCVMFIHGGGFRSGSKRSGGNLNVVCRKLLEHGIAVVSMRRENRDNRGTLKKHSIRERMLRRVRGRLHAVRRGNIAVLSARNLPK